MKIRQLRDTIFRDLRKLRYFVVIVFAVTNLFSILSAYLMGELLDSAGTSQERVMGLGVVAVCCILLGFVLDWSQNYLWFRMIHTGIARFRSQVFAYIMENPFSFFVNSKSGDVVNRILNDVAQYGEQTLIALPMLIINLSTLVLVYGFIVWMNYRIGLLLILMGGIYFFSYRYINGKLKNYSLLERKRYSDLMDCAANYYEGIPAIKLFRREREFAARYHNYVQELCRQAISLQKWKSLSLCISGLVIDLMPVCVIVTGVYFVIRGSSTVGSLFSIYACIPALGEPIRNLTDYNLMVQSGRVNEKRIEELLCGESRNGEGELAGIDSLSVSGLGFAYNADTPVLQNVNFQAKRGDVVGIVGASGAGKSTLLRLLTGQLSPTQGSILVNGHPLESLSYSAYLSRIAIAPQNIFLYHDSIVNNIRFERTLSEDKLDALLDILKIRDYADRPVNGMSGGEKRRVGLARALAGDFDLLILDEPTADIDGEMEKKIIDFLAGYVERHNIILLIVTHREAILSICDTVLRI